MIREWKKASKYLHAAAAAGLKGAGCSSAWLVYKQNADAYSEPYLAGVNGQLSIINGAAFTKGMEEISGMLHYGPASVEKRRINEQSRREVLILLGDFLGGGSCISSRIKMQNALEQSSQTLTFRRHSYILWPSSLHKISTVYCVLMTSASSQQYKIKER